MRRRVCKARIISPRMLRHLLRSSSGLIFSYRFTVPDIVACDRFRIYTSKYTEEAVVKCPELYYVPGLHAKLYVFDGLGVVVGSSNMTAIGLGTRQKYDRHEILVFTPCLEGLDEWIQNITSRARRVQPGEEP